MSCSSCSEALKGRAGSGGAHLGRTTTGAGPTATTPFRLGTAVVVVIPVKVCVVVFVVELIALSTEPGAFVDVIEGLDVNPLAVRSSSPCLVVDEEDEEDVFDDTEDSLDEDIAAAIDVDAPLGRKLEDGGGFDDDGEEGEDGGGGGAKEVMMEGDSFLVFDDDDEGAFDV